jgi:hypothetical protein
MKATDVFTPGALPEYTYYNREKLNLEARLVEAIETKGMISSVAGPSKSGKTVLCETVIGTKGLLPVPGGGISDEPLFWKRLRGKLQLPVQQTASTSREKSAEFGAKGEAAIGLKVLAQAKGGVEGKLGTGSGSEQSAEYEGPDGIELLDYIRARGLTLLIDDFHYITPDVQRSLAEQLKEAARAGAQIVTVSVSHRSDQAIRANPDLRGRVVTIDIPYWKPEELLAIPKAGFPLLNVDPDYKIVERLVTESLSSPQLMQALCLQFCREIGVEYTAEQLQKFTLDAKGLSHLLHNTAALANCKTAFDIILAGPKIRGRERKLYQMSHGKDGDLYEVLLRALALGEPSLSFSYQDIKKRIAEVVPVDPPRGVDISEALDQVHRRVMEKLGEDRVLDWDAEKETLDIPDPYFLYYMRWSEW